MAAKLAVALNDLDALPATLELIRKKNGELKDSEIMTRIEELYITAVQDTERQITDIERQLEEGSLDPVMGTNDSCDLLRIISEQESLFMPSILNVYSKIIDPMYTEWSLIELIRCVSFLWPEEPTKRAEDWVVKAICNNRVKLLEFLLKANYMEYKTITKLRRYLTPGQNLYDWSRGEISGEIVGLLLWHIDEHLDFQTISENAMYVILGGVWYSEIPAVRKALFQSRLFREYPGKHVFVGFASYKNFPELEKVLKDEFGL